MRNINLSNVSENNKPVADGYVLTVTNVEDHPMNEATGKGDYLLIEYDIAEGEYKDYYYGMMKSLGFWGGKFVRSYKPQALGMFKQFVKELENDNDFFHWDDNGEFDEQSMIGCKFGAILGEEEYRGNDGSIKKRLNLYRITTIDKIHEGDYKVPELKKLQGTQVQSAGVVDTTAETMEDVTEDTPF